MLFETHVFWREMGEGPKGTRAAAAGLAYRYWGERDYPADSHPRVGAAIRIDRAGALRSASSGLAQIMGFNHKAAGYVSAEAMTADVPDDEEWHVEAMVRFIISEGLDDDLREHRREGFALG